MNVTVNGIDFTDYIRDVRYTPATAEPAWPPGTFVTGGTFTVTLAADSPFVLWAYRQQKKARRRIRMARKRRRGWA
jgi:hypothetical protein